MNKAAEKWITVILDLIQYEATCDPEQLLSAECDRLIDRHPIAGRVVIVGVGVILTVHLANLVDDRWDLMSKKHWERWRRYGRRDQSGALPIRLE